jgi:hypothetical protein
MTTVIMRQKDIRPAPARIEFKGMKFLITDRPSDVTIHTYIMVSNLTKKKTLFLFVVKSFKHSKWLRAARWGNQLYFSFRLRPYLSHY